MSLSWVSGINSVAALMESAVDRVESVWAVQGSKNKRIQELVEQAQRQGLDVVFKPLAQLSSKVESSQHQGIIAQWNSPQNMNLDSLLERLKGIKNPLILVLEEITDPRNLGACLRVAGGAGVDAVIKTMHQSASITPIAWKTSAGAAATVPVCEVSSIPKALKKLQDAGLWSYGLAGEATQSIYQTDLSSGGVIVMGSEGSGLKKLTRKHCDFLISLPLLGQVESLNVSVATGVTLYEAVRQRIIKEQNSTD